MLRLEVLGTTYEIDPGRAEKLRNLGALVFRDSDIASEDETLVLNPAHRWSLSDVETLLAMDEPL